MLWAIILVFTVYIVLITRVSLGWRELDCINGSDSNKPSVSILVAARNEEDQIKGLMAALLAQDGMDENCEIIIVDDHSEDATVAITELFVDKYPFVKLLKNIGVGKKAALTTGVHQAQGEWILVTDADCTVKSDWLRNYQKRMLDSYHMMSGPIMLKTGSMFGTFQEQEQAALTAVGAVAVNNGIPSMVNAANMAFRKTTFIEVGGYSGNRDIPTGDDEFLLKSIIKKYPDGVKYLKCNDVTVEAPSTATLGQFISQRRRWASKWKRQFMPLFALMIFLFYLLYILTIIWGVMMGYTWMIGLILFKILADYNLIKAVQKFLKRKTRLFPFIIGQILYPVYAILIAILANFGSYSWKGRKYTIK